MRGARSRYRRRRVHLCGARIGTSTSVFAITSFEARLGTTLGIGQTEPVTVILDRAIPAGPWDARIVLRSGTTEREASAKIIFPTADATSSGAVATIAPPGSRLPFILAGAAVLAGVLLLVWRRYGVAARAGATVGRRTVNVVPAPGSETKPMEPRWRSVTRE